MSGWLGMPLLGQLLSLGCCCDNTSSCGQNPIVVSGIIIFLLYDSEKFLHVCSTWYIYLRVLVLVKLSYLNRVGIEVGSQQ